MLNGGGMVMENVEKMLFILKGKIMKNNSKIFFNPSIY